MENKNLSVAGEREIITSLVINGDLSKLTPVQQVQYYNMFCDSLGLNPLTKPFDLVNLQGKKVLYANKNCAEQLRRNNGVSFLEMHQEIISELCVTTVKGQDKTGRLDVETGAVSIKGLSGNDLANAMMKSATKAKRRLTLSLCSIGVLDETELETIPNAERQEINITGTVTETFKEEKQASAPVSTAPAATKPASQSKLSPEGRAQIIEVGMEMIENKYNGWTERRLELKVQKAEIQGDAVVLPEMEKEYVAFLAFMKANGKKTVEPEVGM